MRLVAPLTLTTLFLLANCVPAPTPAPAPAAPLGARWVHLGGTPRYQVFLDTASIVTISPREVQVWITTTFDRDYSVAGIRYRSMRKLMDVQCERRAIRLHKTLLLDALSRQVFVSEYPDANQAQYRAVDPESVDEGEYNLLCSALTAP